MNVTYAAPAEGTEAATQLPDGTQSMIGSYQVTGVVEFAKQMEEEGGWFHSCTFELLSCQDWTKGSFSRTTMR